MMNLNECRIKELEQENAELEAHVERLSNLIEDNYLCSCKETWDGILEVLEETPTQSPQEHDRQVIIDAHIAGQAEAGIDPSYSNAQLYANNMGGKGE